MFTYRVVEFPSGDTWTREVDCTRKEGLQKIARYNESEERVWSWGERTRLFHREERQEK